jgi:coenzyme F420-0:L-glutamate ligase / coenzyme F420-1:gamma-L-glutamate ligase
VTVLTAVAVGGLPEVREGDDIARLLLGAGAHFGGSDVLVVAHKIVSKAEGRTVALSEVTPSEQALELASGTEKDPRAVQVVLDETAVLVRAERGVLICRTPHGFVCANAGVDLSNVEDGVAALLPVDADRSARHIRDALRARAGVDAAVIVSDTFGRAWRHGLTDVAIGVAGVAAVVDLRGETDGLGRELQVTEVAVADEIAGAAELVMGKAARIAAAIVRGLDPSWQRDGSARELVRAPHDDLFR